MACTHLVLLTLLALADAKLPVVLVPNMLGSVLSAKVNRTMADTPHWYCRTHADWGFIWLQLHKMALLDCLNNELSVSVVTNNATHRYQNATGVHVLPVDFGGLDGVSSVDPLLPLITHNFDALISAFVAKGYKPGHDLVGAPYDFRLAPDGLLQVLQSSALSLSHRNLPLRLAGTGHCRRWWRAWSAVQRVVVRWWSVMVPAAW